jgi:hypothetical protein
VPEVTTRFDIFRELFKVDAFFEVTSGELTSMV